MAFSGNERVSPAAYWRIVIELGGARVRIESALDPASLRATLTALDSLRR